jgi:hypothetical protein
MVATTIKKMMNDQTRQELKHYVRKTLWASSIIILLIVISGVLAYIFQRHNLAQMIFGAFLGAVLSSVNLFALGYAFWALVLAKKSRWALLWPVISFLGMSFFAFILAIYFGVLVLGFAFGLSMPVIIAALVITKGRNDN